MEPLRGQLPPRNNAHTLAIQECLKEKKGGLPGQFGLSIITGQLQTK